jgi:hypothetical protein
LVTLSKEEIIELLGALDHLSHSNNINSHHENNNDILKRESSSIKLDEYKVLQQ